MPARPTADDKREELEALLRQRKASDRLVAEVMTAADAYAKAARKESPTSGPPAEPKAPTVHFAAKTGYAACRPFDGLSTRGWEIDDDPELTTCGHCRKTDCWRKAAGP